MEEKKNIPQDIQPIQVSVKLDASIDNVWEAITQPKQMRAWYFDIEEDNIEDGSVFSFYEPGDKKAYYHECLVLEFEKPTQFRHTWAYPKISQGSSTVNWDLKEDGEGTEVILTHESVHELADAGAMMTLGSFAEGWLEILDENLRAYVEN